MPTLHAILRRDGRRWERAEWRRLTSAEDGALELSRLPGSVSGVHIEEPYRASPSGLVVSSCDESYFTMSIEHKLVFCRLALRHSTVAANQPGRG